MKRLILSLFVSLLALGLPMSALAASYGEGTYGTGTYNLGELPPTPPPTPTPSSAPSPSPTLVPDEPEKPDGERSSSKPSKSSPSAPGCSAQKPVAVPDLFQINAQIESVTVYLAPVPNPRDRYFVSYSTNENAEEHGFEFKSDSSGVIAVDIRDLQAHTVYYFKVRAGNDCQPGDWSNILSVQTGQRFPSYRWSSLPRIVSTGIVSTVKPSLVERIEADPLDVAPIDAPQAQQETVPAVTVPSETEPPPQPQYTPPTDEADVNQPPGSRPEQATPSIFSRVATFFKRLFGR